MAKVKIKLNRQAVGQMLKSQEMRSILASEAKAISTRAGGEFAVRVAPTRAIAIVKGDDGNNKLLKAVRK